jgi:protein O-GlcNAc transferase
MDPPIELLRKAVALHKEGRIDEARIAYDNFAKSAHKDSRATRLLALVASHSGQRSAARQTLEQFLHKAPNTPEILHLLALIDIESNRLNEALIHIQTALTTEPKSPILLETLGRVRLEQQRLPEAEQAFRAALKEANSLPEAHNGLGRVAMALQQWDVAESSFRSALIKKPKWFVAHSNMGMLFLKQKEWKAAKEQFQFATTTMPTFMQAWCGLTEACIPLGETNLAVKAAMKAVEIQPASYQANDTLGRALWANQQPKEALSFFEKARSLHTTPVAALNNIAALYRSLGQLDEAMAHIEQAIAMDSNRPECWNIRGLIHMDLSSPSDALECFAYAIELDSRHEPAQLNHAHTLWSSGLLESSIESLEKAIESNPASTALRSRLIMAMHYSPRFAATRLRDKASVWATDLNSKLDPLPNQSLPSEIKRIGLVSADFRSHPIGWSMGPIIAEWKRLGVEVYGYSNHHIIDAVTKTIRSQCDGWRPIHNISDDQVIDVIQRDKIDALIDLSGHTAGHRLSVFARKPAPLVFTWMGFFGTTGLSSFNGVLTDTIVMPESHQAHNTEPIVDIGRCFFAVDPTALPDLPVTPPPSIMNEHVTFGSFNNPLKYNIDVARTWIEILKKVPNSTLRLGYNCIDTTTSTIAITRFFVDAGLPEEQLIIGHGLERSALLAEYGRVDIALDPHPVNGGMTTCEAMWMGVPVLTQQGDRQSNRIGASLVTAAGHPEWVAATPAQFIDKAIQLALDVDRRTVIRRTLRKSMLESPLCDSTGLARSILAKMAESCRP